MPLHPETRLELVRNYDDLGECLRWMEQTRPGWLGLDTETTGLTWWNPGDHMRMLQVGDERCGWAIPWDMAGALREPLRDYLHSRPVAMHHASFDLHFLRVAGFQLDDLHRNIHDTQVMAHLVNPLKSTALKSVAARIVDPMAGAGDALLHKFFRETGYFWHDVPIETDVYWCVPTDTRVLTRRGWLKHDEVRPHEDETLGYDETTGTTVWTTIRKVQTFDDAPTVTIGNDYWETECTAEHRWVMRKGVSQTVTTLPLSEGWKDKSTTKLVTSAPSSAPGTSDLTPGEAAVLAWILADGNVTWGQKGGYPHLPNASISQHVNKFAEEVEALLKREGAFVSTRLGDADGANGCLRWSVSSAYVRRVWGKAGMAFTRDGLGEGFDPTQFVLTLAPEAREAWWVAWVQAEGTQGTNVLTQNYGPWFDALMVTAYMEGYTPRAVDKDGRCGSIRYSAREMTPQKTKIRDAGTRQQVWCPVTDLGTWTAQDRDGRVFLTGNTYAALDPVLTVHVANALYNKVAHLRDYETERAFAVTVAFHMERLGVHVNSEYVEERYSVLGPYLDDLQRWVAEQTGSKVTNPNADAQVRNFLLGAGCEFTKLTPKATEILGSDSVENANLALATKTTEAETLLRAARGASKKGVPTLETGLPIKYLSLDGDALAAIGHPVADAVKLYRDQSRIRNTYLKAYRERPDANGMLHASIKSMAAVTGRSSIEQPSMQNLPRSKHPRNAVMASPGNRLVLSDFDQIEGRLAAHLSGDTRFIAAIAEGDRLKAAGIDGHDLHSVTARLVFGIPTDAPVPKEKRSIAKAITFGILYGAGDEKVALMTGMPVMQAKMFREQYLAAIPGIPRWNARLEQQAHATHRQTGAAFAQNHSDGRQWFIPHPNDAYRLLNYVCQGEAALVLKRACLRIHEQGWQDYLRLPIHDEVLMDVPEEHVDEVLRDLPQVMQDDSYDVPLTADAHAVDVWGDSYPV